MGHRELQKLPSVLCSLLVGTIFTELWSFQSSLAQLTPRSIPEERVSRMLEFHGGEGF